MRVLASLLLIAGPALAAPLPFPKPAASPIVPDVCYRLEWCPGCSPYVVVFHRGGCYECFREGEAEACYAGRWRVEGGTLHVDEHDRAGNPVAGWRWTWHPRRGATLGGNDARIRILPRP